MYANSIRLWLSVLQIELLWITAGTNGNGRVGVCRYDSKLWVRLMGNSDGWHRISFFRNLCGLDLFRLVGKMDANPSGSTDQSSIDTFVETST